MQSQYREKVFYQYKPSASISLPYRWLQSSRRHIYEKPTDAFSIPIFQLMSGDFFQHIMQTKFGITRI